VLDRKMTLPLGEGAAEAGTGRVDGVDRIVHDDVESGVRPVIHRDYLGYCPGADLRGMRWGSARSHFSRWTGCSTWLSRNSPTSLRGILFRRRLCRTRTRNGIQLYVERRLAAPLQRPEGRLVVRGEDTPQGAAISLLLANILVNDTRGMAREYLAVSFERYWR
jgi:RNA-directed DNA polymerase